MSCRQKLLGIGRLHGKPKKRANALPVEDLELILASLAAFDTLKAKRDTALLQLGCFGAFRRSELVHLCVEDIAWEAEGIVVTIPRSKTDQ